MTQLQEVRGWLAIISDKKFIASTILALAGIVVPVWLWQSDQNPQSLEMQILSTAPMKINASDAGDDIQIVVGGVPVPTPYLSTIELANNGKRPVQAADFHRPLVFKLAGDSQLVRAVVTSTWPGGIDATLNLGKQSISLMPLLLNPGDTIRFAVITSAAPPSFSVNARIAGVQRIAVVDRTVIEQRWGVGLACAFAAICLLIAYIYFAFAAMRGQIMVLSRGASALLAISVAAGGVALLKHALVLLDFRTDNLAGISMIIVGLALLWHSLGRYIVAGMLRQR